MKLSLQSIRKPELWTGYHLPAYDVEKIVKNTEIAPKWLHFGCGNIFRIFPAAICQRLIERGETDTGIVCCESYDDEIISKCFTPFDNLSVAVTLLADGGMEKEVIGSMAVALTAKNDFSKIRACFENGSLQMVSFTITEKGYAIRGTDGELLQMVKDDIEAGPEACRHLMSMLAELCIFRGRKCAKPLALCSMDNCSHNGEKLRNAVIEIAKNWLDKQKITQNDFDFLNEKISFPWSMIDKITPRPNELVEAELIRDGLEGMTPFVTEKNTYTAAFVNSEKPQYLVMEDDFPNGRPALDKAGVLLCDRATVNLAERMKVTTCLNPLHTAMSVYGCMLGYTRICEEMKDADIVSLITRLGYREGLPVVDDPKILSPKEFIDEVVKVRLPNPFMPDAPQRIATDTSQKVGVRFGETIKSYVATGRDLAVLRSLPLAIAGWLRYLLAVDDEGNPMEVSSDPLKDELQAKLTGIAVGRPETYCGQLREILNNAVIFGSDLTQTPLSELIEEMFVDMIAGKNAVRATLKKYLA